MSKVLRGQRAMWLTFDKGPEEKWTCLGKDSDDLSIDTNPDTEQIKNVQGETTFVNNGYTPSMSNEYVARTEDSIYEHIQKIADTLSVSDEDCKATMIVATLDIEVKDATGETTANGNGYQVPVQIVVDNDGGSTAGYSIPFTINEDGARVQGKVEVTNKSPEFTAGEKYVPVMMSSRSPVMSKAGAEKGLSD